MNERGMEDEGAGIALLCCGNYGGGAQCPLPNSQRTSRKVITCLCAKAGRRRERSAVSPDFP